MNLGRYEVMISKPTPRMRLSEKVSVTPEFRAEMNEWMLVFFGVEYPMKKGEFIISEINGVIFARDDDYHDLVRTMRAQEGMK